MWIERCLLWVTRSTQPFFIERLHPRLLVGSNYWQINSDNELPRRRIGPRIKGTLHSIIVFVAVPRDSSSRDCAHVYHSMRWNVISRCFRKMALSASFISLSLFILYKILCRKKVTLDMWTLDIRLFVLYAVSLWTFGWSYQLEKRGLKDINRMIEKWKYLFLDIVSSHNNDWYCQYFNFYC